MLLSRSKTLWMLPRESENSWFEQNGLEPPGEAYFCAAIAMLNLKWMRAHRVIERAGVFVAAYPDLRFADQTIMNHLMRGHVCDMPTYLHTISRTEHRGFSGFASYPALCRGTALGANHPLRHHLRHGNDLAPFFGSGHLRKARRFFSSIVSSASDLAQKVHFQTQCHSGDPMRLPVFRTKGFASQ